MAAARVVVTGATGNLGSSLVELLAAAGADVVGLARHRPPTGPDVRWVEADVAEADLVPIFRGADAVVHLAWRIQPSHQPDELWRTNVVGSSRVFDAVERSGAGALVHASSVGAYSPGRAGQRVDESWPTGGNPALGYAWQKAYVERLLDAVEERRPDLRVVRMRPALIFKREAARRVHSLFVGPLIPPPVLAPALLSLVEHSPLPLQVVHTFDVARAFQLAVEDGARGAFNVATEPVLGASHPPAPAVVAAAKALTAGLWRTRAVRAEPGWVATAAAIPLLDATRARTELGWEPVYDARATVHELQQGMRLRPQEPDGSDAPMLPTDGR